MRYPNMRFSAFLTFIILPFFLTGCGGILTPSQITEIQKFSVASKSYSEFPGAVIRAHSTRRLNRKLADASSIQNGETALNKIKSSLEREKKYHALAARTDQACKMLGTYAAILEKLSSDVYTANTQASLETLAGQMDQSITAYNQISGKTLKPFGNLLATALRGVGGFYIKNRQHKAIQEAVTHADPVIKEMTQSIVDLLDTYSGEKSLELIQAETEELESWYQSFALREPLASSLWFAGELKASESALLLAETSKTAARKLHEAHAVLAKKIQQPMDLKGAIETIKTLVDEVEAAKDFKKKLDEK